MSDLVDVTLPSEQSEGTRSQVLTWLKAVGDSVAENEPLVEIETDKVTVEIPSPCNGRLSEILAPANTEVEPGQTLGRIDRLATSAASTSQPAVSVGPAATTGAESAARPVVAAHSATALSPAVRRLLAEHQLDAGSIAGSGVGGKISIDDVLRHISGGGPASPSAVPSAPAEPPEPTQPGAVGARLVPHSRMRRQIAERMVASLLHTAPHVTTVFEIDLAKVMAHRSKWRADFENRGAALTFTAYFLAACVDGLRAVPELNGRWRPEALEVYDQFDIGVATALADGGLVVPVIRDVASLDLFGIACALGEQVKKAREDRLTPADVRGGTFTISNHGVSGSLFAAPIIINQPQSAILGIGKVEKRATVGANGGQDVLIIRPRCYVSLTIDHRVLDGQRANQFLTVLAQRLENWES